MAEALDIRSLIGKTPGFFELPAGEQDIIIDFTNILDREGFQNFIEKHGVDTPLLNDAAKILGGNTLIDLVFYAEKILNPKPSISGLLLEKISADFEKGNDNETKIKTCKKVREVLFKAASEGWTEGVHQIIDKWPARKLIDGNANMREGINEQTVHYTAVRLAVENGHPKTLEKLLEIKNDNFYGLRKPTEPWLGEEANVEKSLFDIALSRYNIMLNKGDKGKADQYLEIAQFLVKKHDHCKSIKEQQSDEAYQAELTIDRQYEKEEKRSTMLASAIIGIVCAIAIVASGGAIVVGIIAAMAIFAGVVGLVRAFSGDITPPKYQDPRIDQIAEKWKDKLEEVLQARGTSHEIGVNEQLTPSPGIPNIKPRLQQRR